MLTHVAAAVSPFLIATAPPGHHYVVAFETCIPTACLVALAVLYIMSPAAAYMEALHRMPRMWLHMSMVPLLVPVLVVALMHLIRRGLVVVFVVGT
eukprot:395321-Rhodomonas_salina.1